MSDLIELSHNGPYGNPIAELSEYRDGYLIKCYNDEDIPCISFDYISKEDGDEILKYKDSPMKAFCGCGAEEIYANGSYTRLKEIFEFNDIISAILSDKEIGDFMNKVAKEFNLKKLYQFMEESLEPVFEDNDDELDNVMKLILAQTLLSEQCAEYARILKERGLDVQYKTRLI